MPVAKTASPKVSVLPSTVRSAPKASPRKVRPSSSIRTAGGLVRLTSGFRSTRCSGQQGLDGGYDFGVAGRLPAEGGLAGVAVPVPAEDEHPRPRHDLVREPGPDADGREGLTRQPEARDVDPGLGDDEFTAGPAAEPTARDAVLPPALAHAADVDAGHRLDERAGQRLRPRVPRRGQRGKVGDPRGTPPPAAPHEQVAEQDE